MSCSRSWEVEALEDGRLVGHGAAAFQEHVSHCTECARELTDLRALTEQLSRVEPRKLSPFEQRKQRADLLQKAHELGSGRVEPSHRWTRAAGVAALALVAVCLSFWWWDRSGATPDNPTFELRPVSGAVFRDKTNGPRGNVVLSTGALAIHVEHLQRGQRFVLTLPDGELEVLGTRFFAEVQNEHTQRVLVTEGVVTLRLAGAPERAIAAGESWSRSAERAAPPAAPRPLGTAVSANDMEQVPLVGAAQSSAERPASSSGPHSSSPSPSTPRQTLGQLEVERVSPARGTSGEVSKAVPVASPGVAVAPAPSTVEHPGKTARDLASSVADFNDAMSAFSSGAYGMADERLRALVAQHPEDSHVEDAMFLRIVIAQRRGDAEAESARAHEYLARFPIGFRHAEVERVLAR